MLREAFWRNPLKSMIRRSVRHEMLCPVLRTKADWLLAKARLVCKILTNSTGRVLALFIIVTSKPNEYDAAYGDGVRAVETYKYYFYGTHRATFTIGEVVENSARVTITDAEYPDAVNSVPIKFFGDFGDADEARHELEELTRFGDIDARLERVA